MPNVSKETASEHIASKASRLQSSTSTGATSSASRAHTADADLADLFRGLPDDRVRLVEFSPTAVLAETIPVVTTNLAAAGVEAGGSS